MIAKGRQRSTPIVVQASSRNHGPHAVSDSIHKDRVPFWPCPTCGKGHLQLLPKSLVAEETADSGDHSHEAWEPDWIRYVYSCVFVCSNNACRDRVASCGTGRVDANEYEDPEHGWAQTIEDLFSPSFFHPPLRLLDTPADCPLDAAKHLGESFALFFADPGASLNCARTAIESVLTDLSHATTWKTWLLQCNDHPEIDRLRILGRLLEEFMEVDPSQEFAGDRRASRSNVEQILAKYGLRYRTGGRVVEVATGPATKSLNAALAKREFDALQIEFERAVRLVHEDPPAAVTASCALLEALFRAYFEGTGVPLPDKQTIKPLWAVVKKGLNLEPKDQADQDVQRVLSGLGSVVDGIGAFRTHAGSAHGGGRYRYKVQAPSRAACRECRPYRSDVHNRNVGFAAP